MKTILSLVAIASFVLGLVACSDKEQQKLTPNQAVAMEVKDECHLCGMIIQGFEGPKGQLYRRGVTAADGRRVHKFCSTRDLFSFYLEPENKRNVTDIFVHDMSQLPWSAGAAESDYFIDARTAWYVAGSSQTGAMGKTLASFASKNDAELFAKSFGGQVMSFEQINRSVLM